MDFFERLKLELEDLHEDLAGLPLNTSDCRAGDFGCGSGYTTLGLIFALHVGECIGVDKFMGNWLSPSLQDVQRQFDAVRETLLTTPDDSPDEDSLKGDIRRLLSEGRYPLFQKHDIVKSNKLPNNLDFAYCKKVLGNIYTGEYDNSLKGEEAVSLAITNIAGTIRYGGLVCLVEKAGINFAPFLEQAGLMFLRTCRVRRGEIGEHGRLTSSAMIGQYVIYFYRKPQ
jgi:SAM-dependent methyltransferase